MLTPKQIERLEKQQYRVVGKHSAVKVCHWTKECVRSDGQRACYKQYWYGISSANCMEMSPSITCNLRCQHCWRDNTVFSSRWNDEPDDPKEIIRGCIEARQSLVVGFKGRPNVNVERVVDALKPNHAAISLTGEPCMYPRLPEMVDAFFDDFNFKTVFLVTNGTVPEMLRRFGKDSKHFPTNIYLSLQSFDVLSYKNFNHPVATPPLLWEKTMESMRYLSTIKDKTRTIMRITLVKGLNLDKAAELLPYIQLMGPTHVEVKAYAFMGYSRRRLKQENAPRWAEVQAFAAELEKISDYAVSGSQEQSDVIQLSRLSCLTPQALAEKVPVIVE